MKNRFDYECETYTDFHIFKDNIEYITAKKFNILSEEWRLVRDYVTLKNGYTCIVVGFSRKRNGNQWHLIGYNKPKRPVFYCIFDEKYDNYENQNSTAFLDFFEENVKKAENYKELLKILEVL